MSILSQKFVFDALEAEKNGEQFPVNFDNVWSLLGYSRKSDALSCLLETHDKGKDFEFCGVRRKTPNGGRPSHSYVLTIDSSIKRDLTTDSVLANF